MMKRRWRGGLRVLPCPQVIAALPAYQRRWQQADAGAGAAAVPAEVDLETVMWTDPDVLFRNEIDSCSLPMPRLLSIGPEVGGSWGTPGMNVQACTPAVLAWHL